MLFSHLRRRALLLLGSVAVMAAGLASVPSANASSGFGDVTLTDYFAEPVQWLVDEGLTDGTSPGCYSPQGLVNRAQFATFLHRYAGEPGGVNHGFSDVPAGTYYEDAVRWMVGAGLTTGTSPSTFSPGQSISRAELAAFLYRFAGQPSAPISNFSDVPRSAYYATAVDWMVSAGITNGTSATTFSPGRTLSRAELATFLYRFAGEPSVDVEPGGFCEASQQMDFSGPPIYSNEFATAADGHRIDEFIHYRDAFLVAHTTGSSDHASTGGINCTAPEESRSQAIESVAAHVYQCLPGGNPAAGHMMAYAMDSSGYGFAGALPDQVFTDVRQVAVDINTTSAGSRNFVEIKVLPANATFVDAMPCGPNFPCNDGYDYDDLGGVGASTQSINGTGMFINTPEYPDGMQVQAGSRQVTGTGDRIYSHCTGSGWCGDFAAHADNPDVRSRYQHIFRDNGNGTLSFGIRAADGTTDWLIAPGSFPDGPVRVVVAFHNYTGTKDGHGPGFDNNLSASTGGFTWHWDNLQVHAGSSTPSEAYFGGNNAERIVTPDGCVSFALGPRSTSHHTHVAPQFVCDSQSVSLSSAMEYMPLMADAGDLSLVSNSTAAGKVDDEWFAFCELPKADATA